MCIRRADGGPKYNDAHEVIGHNFLDPSPAYERWLEVASAKNDTTRMTIAVLTQEHTMPLRYLLSTMVETKVGDYNFRPHPQALPLRSLLL